MNIILTFAAVIVIAFSGIQARADSYMHFPGASADQRTLNAQNLVEELYDSGDYERSLIIYQKELAPIGDKYAQYMVGYMLLAGQGVEQSKPKALAWFRLAAERGDPAIVQSRDKLHQSMSQAEVVESNQIFVELWRELGDNNLILDLVRKDLDTLRARTGSRIPGSNSSPITIVRPSTGETSGEAYYDRVRKRMEMRLEFLDSNIEIIDIDLSDEFAVRKSLETEIRAEMAALENY